MVSDLNNQVVKNVRVTVLILVWMEDGLWLNYAEAEYDGEVYVLILVWMEDSLWPPVLYWNEKQTKVLILVWMEDSLWQYST